MEEGLILQKWNEQLRELMDYEKRMEEGLFLRKMAQSGRLCYRRWHNLREWDIEEVE